MSDNESRAMLRRVFRSRLWWMYVGAMMLYAFVALTDLIAYGHV